MSTDPGGFVGQDLAAMEALERQLLSGAEQLAGVNQQSRNLVGALQNIWRGQVTDAFAHMWHNSHSPSVQSAERSLRDAAEIISRNIDDQRSTSDNFERVGGAAGAGGAGPRTNAQMQANIGGAGPLPGQPGSGVLAEPQDARDLWGDDYYDSLIDYEVPLDNQAQTNTLMEELFEGDLTEERLDEVLDQLAENRGYDDPAEFRLHYDRYVELRDEAIATKGHTDATDPARHPDFLGSPMSLRYGQIVGDALGVDPLFGALLNPTGGLVGPGNESFTPDWDDALGYHGSIHDAAGYLYNYHREGPGYDYIGNDGKTDFLGTDNPATGQWSGSNYWMDRYPELDGSISGAQWSQWQENSGTAMSVGLTVAEGAYIVGNTAVDSYHTARDGLVWAADTAVDVGQTTWDAGVYAADWAVDTAADAARDVNSLVEGSGDGIRRWAGDTASDVGGELADTASDVGDWAGDKVSGLGGLWP